MCTGSVVQRVRLVAVPLILSLASCGQPDPNQEAAVAYVRTIEPLLAENGLVFARVLEVAADVYNDEVVKAETRLAWRQDLVPLAEHLRDQAGATEVPIAWDADHDALVEIWGVRADAWRDIADAIELGDTEQWRRGRQEADEAKLREEAWFRGTNAKLAPHGLSLDQFP